MIVLEKISTNYVTITLNTKNNGKFKNIQSSKTYFIKNKFNYYLTNVYKLILKYLKIIQTTYKIYYYILCIFYSEK